MKIPYFVSIFDRRGTAVHGWHFKRDAGESVAGLYVTNLCEFNCIPAVILREKGVSLCSAETGLQEDTSLQFICYKTTEELRL